MNFYSFWSGISPSHVRFSTVKKSIFPRRKGIFLNRQKNVYFNAIIHSFFEKKLIFQHSKMSERPPFSTIFHTLRALEPVV